jgi:zinc-ribbon domain
MLISLTVVPMTPPGPSERPRTTTQQLHAILIDMRAIKEGQVYCAACGARLPDDASFCMRCGKAQQAGTAGSPEQWEVCTIDRFSTEGDQKLTWRRRPYVLKAIARGPKKPYEVERSSEFVLGYWVSDNPGAEKQALDELTAMLVSHPDPEQRWEELPDLVDENVRPYRRKRFRRKVGDE